VTPGGRWTPLVLVALAALLPSLPVLQGDLVADDFGCLRLWGEKPFRDFLVFGDISEGIWGIPLDEARPVDALSFRLGFLVSGAQAWGHLLLALAFHVACALLVYALCRAARPTATGLAAVAAGVLFAVHPVHAEAIAWVTGKVDSLAAAAYLGSLVLYLRWRAGAGRAAYVAALLAFGLGLLVKEVLLTLPALVVASDLLLTPATSVRDRLARALAAWRAWLPFALIAAAYLTARRLAFGSFAREQRFGSGLGRQLLERQDFNWRELMAPVEGPAAIALAAAVALAFLLAARDRAALRPLLPALVALGVVFYAVTTTPLLFTYLSARHLYLPSAGLAIAAGLLLFPSGRSKTLRVAALVAAAVALAPALYARQEPWIEAGRTSRTLRLEAERLTRDLPLGATLVLWGVPAAHEGALLWRAALPFALQPPFVPRDVAGTLRVIESPDLYCCPAAQWWQRQAATLAALETGPDDEALSLHLLEWRPSAGRLTRRDALVTRGGVRERLERAGLGPEKRRPNLKDGGRLVAVLAQAVRSAPRQRRGEAEP
jgi:hypothetical protein